jgi:hypothetical protein
MTISATCATSVCFPPSCFTGKERDADRGVYWGVRKKRGNGIERNFTVAERGLRSPTLPR